MGLDSLQDLYVEHIRDLYSAERQILQALPKMIAKATSAKLRDGFTTHLEQTKEHATRLEQIAERAGFKAGGLKCKGMEGVIKEGAEVVEEDGDENVIDAGLISAAQRVEHYEMAGYGCARTFAEALGLDDDVALLQQTLDEESETDKILTQLSESILSLLATDAQREISVEREPIRQSRNVRSSIERGGGDEARA
jgi:ferritin-like metal-binding protein YciE